MGRYFLEVAYKGTRYSGFQVQENSNTIQSEVEQAFQTLHRQPVEMTGSSRTDAGVHAMQNYFHFDFDEPVNPQLVYKMNAILPRDITVKNCWLMPADSHSRFDAVARAYTYRLHRFKNPFLQEFSLYYPYPLNRKIMDEAAAFLLGQENFFAFSKTNTQVKNFNCRLSVCRWEEKGEEWLFRIEGNRFLRGMVRLITATLLRMGRGKFSMEELALLFSRERKCGFSVPAHGLFLTDVRYPENYFPATGVDSSAF